MTVLLLTVFLTAGPPPTTWGIENFERQPSGPGWAGWDAPFGPAAAHAAIEVVDDARGKVGQVTYRQAQDFLILPGPDLDLDQRPVALTARARCEGPPPALSVTVIDASGEWLQTPAQGLQEGRWRNVRVPFERFVDHASGDGDGELDLPITALNLNLAFREPADGVCWLDDVALEAVPAPSIAFLDLGMMDPERVGICVLGEPPPAVAVLNRGRSTVELRVSCRLGERSETHLVAPSPHQTTPLAVAVDRTGPQVLEVVAKAGDGEIRRTFVLTVLPPRSGGPSTFYGLGGYDAADVASGRFGLESGLLRAAGADWTMFWLPGRPGESLAANTDPQQFAAAMTLAWAQRLRTVAFVDATRSARPGSGLTGHLAALQAIFGEDPKVYVVPAAEAAQAPSLRAAIGASKLLWGYLGEGKQPDGIGVDGWLAPLPTVPSEPSMLPGPGAWTRLQQMVEPLGPGPLQLWSENWPLEDLSGLDDRGAAMAVVLACARATPGVQGVCFGQVFDSLAAQGLTGPGQVRAELVAFAVASRLSGGLPCRGLISPAPGAYAVMFGDAQERCAVAWTEGAPASLPLREGCRVYDHLGNELAWTAELRLHREPVYVVGESPLSDVLP